MIMIHYQRDPSLQLSLSQSLMTVFEVLINKGTKTDGYTNEVS